MERTTVYIAGPAYKKYIVLKNILWKEEEGDMRSKKYCIRNLEQMGTLGFYLARRLPTKSSVWNFYYFFPFLCPYKTVVTQNPKNYYLLCTY